MSCVSMGGHSELNDQETWSGEQQSPGPAMESRSTERMRFCEQCVWEFIKMGKTGTDGQSEFGDGILRGLLSGF